MTLPSPNDALRRDLAAVVDCKVSNNDADRAAYARDLWPRQQIITRTGNPAPNPPGVVVWPESTEQVQAIISYAARTQTPVIPFGAGSGVCGGVKPTQDAILLDMKRMRRLLEVNEAQLTARAQAGIIGQHLEDELASRGYTAGHFPSSIYCSTLGGWVAGRSAGQCSGRYGKIEDMLLGLECVDGRGRVLYGERGGTNAHLIPLVTGSEGILAAVTEIELRINPAPAQRTFAGFTFPSTENGLEAIRHIYQAGLRPAVARLYDPFDTMLARRGGLKRGHDTQADGPKPAAPGLGVRALVRALRHPGALNKLLHRVPDSAYGGAMLVLVWEDAAELAAAERNEARRIALSFGGKDEGEGPGQRWLSHRHSVSYRQSPIFAAGGFVDTMEVAATWSRLWPMYEAVRAALASHVLVMAHFSHAYPDGASIYFTFASSRKSDAEALAAYDTAWRAALEAVTASGGTISHHHGVGRSKAPAMRGEQGHAVDVIRALKHVMDPAGVMNPGALIGPVSPQKGADHAA